MRHIDQINLKNPGNTCYAYSRENILDRRKFLKLSLKTSAGVYLAMNAVGCDRSPQAPVALKKLSNRDYININIMGEFYLKDTPLDNFNIGQALDKLLYSAPNPHPLESRLLELVSIPSSILAMLYIDKSFVTMAHMSTAERERVFLKWRISRDPLQRGIYALMHSLCMSLISNEKTYQQYTGFTQ